MCHGWFIDNSPTKLRLLFFCSVMDDNQFAYLTRMKEVLQTTVKSLKIIESGRSGSQNKTRRYIPKSQKGLKSFNLKLQFVIESYMPQKRNSFEQASVATGWGMLSFKDLSKINYFKIIMNVKIEIVYNQ